MNPETTTDVPAQVLAVIKALPDDMRARLDAAYLPMARQSQTWLAKAKAIVVRDEHDTEAMAQAGVFRLELAKVRIDAKKKHDELKKPILPYGRAVDEAERMIRLACEPAEAECLEKEQFVERKREAERQQRARERAGELMDLRLEPSLFLTQALEFTPEQWSTFIQGQKDAIAAAKERQRLEDEAAANEKKRLADLEIENRRLAAETAKLKVAVQDLGAANKATEIELAQERLAATQNARKFVPVPPPALRPNTNATDKAALREYANRVCELTAQPLNTAEGREIYGRFLQSIAGFRKAVEGLK